MPVVEAICDAEIPVMGHLGLTPQSFHAMGGFKVQGKDLDAAKALVDDAHALAAAGCFAIVLEGIPDVVAHLITESVAVPTIGIGAGPHCDGQVLVFHDVLGLEDRTQPKFVRQYASLKAERRRRTPGLGGRRARRRLPLRGGDLPHHPGPGRRPDVGLIASWSPAPPATTAGRVTRFGCDSWFWARATFDSRVQRTQAREPHPLGGPLPPPVTAIDAAPRRHRPHSDPTLVIVTP